MFSIQRYAVIPLSTNSGLIGWVPHCDTLHALIRDYREKKKILLNIEHRIMLRVSLQCVIDNWVKLILTCPVQEHKHWALTLCRGHKIRNSMEHKGR